MISLIIPVYNEAGRIRDSIADIFLFLKRYNLHKTEVILVNDGSNDRTASILEELKESYPIRVVSLTVNIGKGGAIKAGIDSAKGELILFTDIDLSVPIEMLDEFVQSLDDDSDIVIGSRVKHGAKVEIRQSWVRETLGESFTFLSNLILGVGVSDFTCGFKLFRKQAAKQIFDKQLIKRWAFDAESLYLAKKYHFRVKEVPVIWRHREGSKVRFPKDLIETLISLFQIRINDLWGKYKI